MFCNHLTNFPSRLCLFNFFLLEYNNWDPARIRHNYKQSPDRRSHKRWESTHTRVGQHPQRRDNIQTRRAKEKLHISMHALALEPWWWWWRAPKEGPTLLARGHWPFTNMLFKEMYTATTYYIKQKDTNSDGSFWPPFCFVIVPRLFTWL